MTSTRRTFVAGAGLALALPAVAFAARGGDAGVLAAAVELEQVAAFAYDAGVKSGLLDEDLARLAGTLRDHEQAHADALASSLEALGGRRPVAPASPQEADAALQRHGISRGLRDLGDGRAFLDLALQLEQEQTALYGQAVAKVGDERLIQTIASIVSAEGQHLVAIRTALGRAPIPTSLETGRP